MRAAAAALRGTHDFTSFTNADPARAGRLQPVRTLQRLDVLAAPPPPLFAPGAETDGAQYLTFAIEACPPPAHPPLPAPLPHRWAHER
jgi:hypothetical protein